MSLFIMMFYWIGIPSFILWIARVLWRRTGVVLYKGLIVVTSVAVFMGLLWLAAGEKWLLDRQVRELCEKDGGIRVYETVTLPPDKFNKYGQVNFYRPDQGEGALGPEYIYKWDIQYYKKGEPAVNGAQEISMRRDHVSIVRKSGIKLLGEVILYHRAGGDLPGPWMPSSYHCPGALEANSVILMNKIFIKSVEGDNK